MSENMIKLRAVKINPAKCALELGDGSERAEYVNQDYILNKLGRPHRNINLMYTYYPKDKEWPQRISVACKDMDIKFQWDYPYDDYFPYGGGSKGNTDGEPFNFMRDIRRHGQDVTLTLTIDCSLKDEELRHIARELKPFGRLHLRINHECAGTWFTHNKRFTHEEIAQFFIKFHNIIKEEAPNILTNFCAGFVKDVNSDSSEVEYESEFKMAYQTADIWSGDCYLALHYGWPFDVCEKNIKSFHTYSVESFYTRLRKTAERLKKINNGISKPLEVSEFNTDGDVTGAINQGSSVKKFAWMIRDNEVEWLSAFSMYQFRDRGRLGLELEDPNNNSVGIEQPILKDYKEILYDPYFMPQFVVDNEKDISLPIDLRYGDAEDAEGLGLLIEFEKTPVFCEIEFEEPLNLMIELRDRWFYKAPSTKVIDMMPAFYERGLEKPEKIILKIFAPPATGENQPDQGNDWANNYYCTINKMPKIRIRYEAVKDVE